MIKHIYVIDKVENIERKRKNDQSKKPFLLNNMKRTLSDFQSVKIYFQAGNHYSPSECIITCVSVPNMALCFALQNVSVKHSSV